MIEPFNVTVIERETLNCRPKPFASKVFCGWVWILCVSCCCLLSNYVYRGFWNMKCTQLIWFYLEVNEGATISLSFDCFSSLIRVSKIRFSFDCCLILVRFSFDFRFCLFVFFLEFSVVATFSLNLTVLQCWLEFPISGGGVSDFSLEVSVAATISLTFDRFSVLIRVSKILFWSSAKVVSSFFLP